KDIWDATALHKIKCPDGKPFAVRTPGASHLVFSLFVDWFNPYRNKKAGKIYSTGAIYMVLNLPTHLWYELENVYLVGLIPGPHKLKLHHMNNIL
ncbi:hypothetical protein SERLA73DRAFT_128765, partial [Serpula lacrymans var. lacrymans S7.3]